MNRLGLVRRGSTVRVRQRALQKPRKAQLFLSGALERSTACGRYGALYRAFRSRSVSVTAKNGPIAVRPASAPTPPRRPPLCDPGDTRGLAGPYDSLLADLAQELDRTVRFVPMAFHVHSPESFDWAQRPGVDATRNDRARLLNDPTGIHEYLDILAAEFKVLQIGTCCCLASQTSSSTTQTLSGAVPKRPRTPPRRDVAGTV